MYCRNCGAEITNVSAAFCPNCGKTIAEKSDNSVVTQYSSAPENDSKIKFMPSFILGLIGSIFGMMGGLCVTMCTSMYSGGGPAFILIFGGSVVGLVGACKCLSNAKTGSIIELISATAIAICSFGITGADFSTIIGLLLIAVGGIIGLLYSLTKK